MMGDLLQHPAKHDCACKTAAADTMLSCEKRRVWWAEAQLTTLRNFSLDLSKTKDSLPLIGPSLDKPWPLVLRRQRSTSSTMTWTTPPDLIAAVLAGLGIDVFNLDPASPNPPSVPCRQWYTKRDNGLLLRWIGEFVWCNPPYERLAPWVRKAIQEHKSGRAKRIALLIPNRPGTRYWRKIVESDAAIFGLDGRLCFGGAPDDATFSCALIVWGLDEAELAKLGACLPRHFRTHFA